MSQRDLARAAGVDKRAVNGWERGGTGITWPKVDRVAEVLGCSAEWIVLGDQVAGAPAAAGTDTPPVVGVLQRIDDRVAGIETSSQSVADILDDRLGRIEALLAELTGDGDPEAVIQREQQAAVARARRRRAAGDADSPARAD